MSNVGASAAAAAAERRRREEEEMTQYTQEDLTNWEFKILRANKFGGFKNTDVLKKVVDEEAQSGWQLIEKFDDYRLRFKRRISDRSRDMHSTIDPYRSIYGMNEATLAWLILGGAFIIPVLVAIMAAIEASN